MVLKHLRVPVGTKRETSEQSAGGAGRRFDLAAGHGGDAGETQALPLRSALRRPHRIGTLRPPPPPHSGRTPTPTLTFSRRRTGLLLVPFLAWFLFKACRFGCDFLSVKSDGLSPSSRVVRLCCFDNRAVLQLDGGTFFRVQIWFPSARCFAFF